MRNFFIFLITGIFLAACQDDREDWHKGDETTTSVTLVAQAMSGYQTRSGQDVESDSQIEHVLLCVFNQQTGEKLACFEQELEAYDKIEQGNIFYNLHFIIGKYQTDVTLCAICNYPEFRTEIDQAGFNLEKLKSHVVQGENANVAFNGRMIMFGAADVTQLQLADRKTAISIPVERIAAKVDLEIKVEPEILSDKFYLSAVELHQIPLCSYLAERPDMELQNDGKGNLSRADNTGDAVYIPVSQEGGMDSGKLQGHYLESEKMDVKEGTPYDYPENVEHPVKTTPYHTRFYLFENRRGKKTESYFSKSYTESSQYQYLKGKLGQKEYPYATYFLIKGVYVSGSEVNPLTQEVSYKVYIGKDNYSDFDVQRNGHYQITATIKATDVMDTRVKAKILNKCQITTFFKNPMDAHFCAGRCFGFTDNDDWELYVEDPDKHPWLEISFSERYRPHQVNQTIPDQAYREFANTRFVGKSALSDYFYIHTDEYIPENPDADEHLNVQNGKNIALDETQWRTGTVVLRDNVNGSEARIIVKQRPAQLVKMPLYNILGQVTGYNEFYVEYELEQHNLTWGFLQFPANPIMTSMINDRWNGLANTRRLYQEAIRDNGAYNSTQWPPMLEFKTPGDAAAALPKDHMIGYVMTKNRDANGNGHIDYDEIRWYVPALNELMELWRVHHDKLLEFEDSDERFHSSTPYLAGYTYEIPGRCFYVKTDRKKGDADYEFKRTAFAMRNRQYNVICCRRKNAWMGKPDGEIDSDITVNPDWNPDDEDIINKH